MKLKRLIALFILLCFFPLPARATITLDDESKYGREIYLQIARGARLYSDPYTSIEIAIIQKRLEDVADLPFHIKLSIIDTPTLDAFATIGGYVYVTTGLLERADKEEEIAGVLGHEFSHVGRRHVAKAIEKEAALNIASVATMLLGLLIPNPAAKAAVVTGSMGTGQMIALKHTREAEEEADKYGVATAEKAGYNGLGTAEFLKKLASTELEKSIPQYLLTHPYSDVRVDKIRQIASPMKTRVDVSLFPFMVTRLHIIGKPIGTQNEEIWFKKYQKEPDDPISTYGAALVYSLKGDTDKAVAMAKTIDSPHAPLFVGEFLVTGRRFDDAIAVLEDQTHPVARYYLAKAYEGRGDLATAGKTFAELAPYAETFPEAYHRLGMVLGRQGNQGGGFEYLGRYYFETGRYQQARVNLEKAIARYGINSPESQDLLRLLDLTRPPGQKKPGSR
jgi:predicted Zn-dependent protease